MSAAAQGWQRDALAVATLARDSAASGAERRVLLLRLSALPPELRRDHHLRLLREALGPLLRPTRARLFELPSGDLVAAAPPPGEHLDMVQAAFRRLVPEEAATARCLQELRLPEEAAALLDVVTEALGLHAAPTPAAARTPGKPARAEEVLAAEAALARADLEVHIRSQAVCRLAEGTPGPQPLWQDHRIALDAVREALLLPGRDLGGAPWLARRLRRRTEGRLIAQWSHPQEVRRFAPRGVALLPGSVLGEEFQRFDRLLPAAHRAGLTVGFLVADIMADPGGFALARGLLGMRGFRTALEDVTPSELPLLPPDLFGVDLVRLRFGPGVLGLDAAGRERLAAALPADRARVVLTGVDVPVAIGWGWERGITRFQGRLMEQQLTALAAGA